MHLPYRFQIFQEVLQTLLWLSIDGQVTKSERVVFHFAIEQEAQRCLATQSNDKEQKITRQRVVTRIAFHNITGHTVTLVPMHFTVIGVDAEVQARQRLSAAVLGYQSA